MFLGCFWGCFWDMCRMFWDIFRMFLGCFWDVFGIFVGCFWDILGRFGIHSICFSFFFTALVEFSDSSSKSLPLWKRIGSCRIPDINSKHPKEFNTEKTNKQTKKLPVLGGQKSSQDVWNHPKESWWILVNPDESWRILVNPGASVREHALTARFPVKLCKRFTANGGETPRIPMNPKESQRILKDRKDGRRRQDGKVEMEEKQPIIQWSDAVRR